jgi:hypothetical protein
MKRASDQVLQALVALNHDPYFAVVKTWLAESREEQREVNDVELDEGKLRQGQGKAQILTEILKEAKDAVSIMQKKANMDTTRPRITQ